MARWLSEGARVKGMVTAVSSDTMSARPPQATLMTGTPAAIASATGSPNPSPRAGWT